MLIVDRELTLDSVFTELAAGIVSQIVLVDDGSETGNRKLRKALEAVKVLEKRKGVPILTKCMLLYNRFSSSHGRKLEKLPVSEAGEFPGMRGRPRERWRRSCPCFRCLKSCSAGVPGAFCRLYRAMADAQR